MVHVMTLMDCSLESIFTKLEIPNHPSNNYFIHNVN